jgi:uncharacterized protein (DUF1499 family)
MAATIPLGPTARVEESASADLFLMAHTFVTGQTIVVDEGDHAPCPDRGTCVPPRV